MPRYSLRNQKKIANSFGEDFLKWLKLSLNETFKQDKIEEHTYDNVRMKIVHSTNIGHPEGVFELYVVSKTYDVFNLAFKSYPG